MSKSINKDIELIRDLKVRFMIAFELSEQEKVWQWFETQLTSQKQESFQKGWKVGHDQTKEDIVEMVEGEVQKEINNQKVPASYEIAHYKMGLEKALDILEKIGE